MTDTEGQPLLQTVELTRHFRIGGLFSGRVLQAVDNVNLSIQPGEILALVGESGSGKSTIARLIVRVYEPTSGQILFEGRAQDLSSHAAKVAYRGRVPMVFQDPFASMNPAYRIRHSILRTIKLHRPELSADERQAEAVRVLEVVGLTPGETYLRKYPHEMSGGQRQRVGFAQALASKPKLIVADEPVSMLDVSIRVGVLNLMAQLREQEGVSFLYITHDLASARYVADRVMVMYAGHQVEYGPTEEVLGRPVHPYTELLLSAVPDPRAPADTSGSTDAAEPPRVVDPGEGCRFRHRCPLAVERCHVETPPLVTVGTGHAAACHVRAPAENPTRSGVATTPTAATPTDHVRIPTKDSA